MLSLVLAESALEIVPKELQNRQSVISYCKKTGKIPSKVLLDVSWHFAAMKGIKNEIKRGRPDLVHFSLLECCTIPLYFKNKIRIFVHTIDDKVILVGKNVRIPKSYHRFAGLIEKLFADKVIEQEGKKFLTLKNMTFEEIIDEIGPDKVIGFSRKGQKTSFDQVSEEIGSNSCIVVGGFSKGNFSENVLKKIDRLVSISSESMEAHVVISRIVYECEKRIIT